MVVVIYVGGESKSRQLVGGDTGVCLDNSNVSWEAWSCMIDVSSATRISTLVVSWIFGALLIELATGYGHSSGQIEPTPAAFNLYGPNTTRTRFASGRTIGDSSVMLNASFISRLGCTGAFAGAGAGAVVAGGMTAAFAGAALPVNHALMESSQADS